MTYSSSTLNKVVRSGKTRGGRKKLRCRSLDIVFHLCLILPYFDHSVFAATCQAFSVG